MTVKSSAMMAVKTEPSRTRGRPTAISRDKVLRVARELLEQDPQAPLTMAKVAKALGLVTMGLYKHVKNKEDLLTGVAELVFAEFQPELNEGDAFIQQLEDWAWQARTFFHANPCIFQLMGWDNHMSQAFLRLNVRLLDLFSRQGLSEREQAINLQWFLRTVISYIAMEMSEIAGEGGQSWNDIALAGPLEPELQDKMAPMLAVLQRRSHKDEFNYFLERTLVSLEVVLSKG